MTQWINESDFDKSKFKNYEVIGVVRDFLNYSKRGFIASKIFINNREVFCSYTDQYFIFSRPYQFRVIDDIQEILKHQPMPKFDWSYC